MGLWGFVLVIANLLSPLSLAMIAARGEVWQASGHYHMADILIFFFG
jgi:hypothetical protein